MNDLMLLGHAEQVELVVLMIRDGADNDGLLNFTPLLMSLRDDLRRELGLAGIWFEEDEAKFFEFSPPDRGQGKRPKDRASSPPGMRMTAQMKDF